MQHIRNDQRIIDFCGEEVRPGWIITKKVAPNNENWVKYDMNVKGLSGKLKTTVIGDYLQQGELEILEKERDEYYRNKAILEAEALKTHRKKIMKLRKRKLQKNISLWTLTHILYPIALLQIKQIRLIRIWLCQVQRKSGESVLLLLLSMLIPRFCSFLYLRVKEK